LVSSGCLVISHFAPMSTHPTNSLAPGGTSCGTDSQLPTLTQRTRPLAYQLAPPKQNQSNAMAITTAT